MLRGNRAVGRSGLAAAASMFIFTGVSHFILPEAMAEMELELGSEGTELKACQTMRMHRVK